MKYSLEHLEYLKEKKRLKKIITTSRIILLGFFFLIWELLAYFSFINTFLYSSPSRIINTIRNLGFLEINKHIYITLFEVFISFIISTVGGMTIASVLWLKPMIAKIFDPFITVFNSLPKVALGPLFIIWIGASTYSIIFMAVTISIFTTIISIYQGFTSVSKDYIIMLQSFSASKWQVFRKIIIPSNIKNILATLKINISLSLIGVIMGELLVSKRGLGYLIMYGSQVFQLDLVISSIFILGVISYMMYYLIEYIMKKIEKY